MKASMKVLVAALLVLALTPLIMGSVTLAKPKDDGNGKGNGKGPYGEDDDDHGKGSGEIQVPPARGKVKPKLVATFTISIINGTAINATDYEKKYSFNVTIVGTIEKLSQGRWKAQVTRVKDANFTIKLTEGIVTYEYVKGQVVFPIRSNKIHIWVAMNTTAGDTAKLILHGKLMGAIPKPPGTVDVDFLAPQSKLVRGIIQPTFFLNATNSEWNQSRLSVA